MNYDILHRYVGIIKTTILPQFFGINVHSKKIDYYWLLCNDLRRDFEVHGYISRSANES